MKSDKKNQAPRRTRGSSGLRLVVSDDVKRERKDNLKKTKKPNLLQYLEAYTEAIEREVRTISNL